MMQIQFETPIIKPIFSFKYHLFLRSKKQAPYNLGLHESKTVRYFCTRRKIY